MEDRNHKARRRMDSSIRTVLNVTANVFFVILLKPLKKGGVVMPIFLMFGNYTTETVKGISSERTEKVVNIIKQNGGEVRSMYAVLGEHDLVFIVDFPDIEKVMAASLAIRKLTGISFKSSPLVEVEKFDRLVSKVKDI
jgi:uncharacterized protein with GYD domain